MIARCACGKVELETVGQPLLSVACHCRDCTEGSVRIEALPNAGKILDSFGGTQHLLYRKDRFKYLKGTEFLKSFKVEEDSPARVYASCCNSYLLLDIPDPAHFAPINKRIFQGETPPLDMRINAKFKKDDAKAPKDAPYYRAFPFRFIKTLIGAKIAMIFGR